MKRDFKILVSLASLALAASCSTEPVTGRSQLNFLSEGEEAQMGAQAYQEILSKSTLVRSGPEYDQVVRVGKKIAQAADEPTFQWEFSLIKDDKNANAICLPGGKIAVYTGILTISQTDAGLAVVVGHEVGHAIAHHGGERVSQHQAASLGVSIVDQFLLGQSSGASRDLVMGLLGAGAQYGVLLPFSREQESSADRIGLELMAKAGYAPEEAVHFWERMQSKSGGGAPPQFLSTHPSHQTRIADLKKWIPAVEAKYGTGGSQASSGRRR